MPRVYNTTTIAILRCLAEREYVRLADLKIAGAPKMSPKDFYNYLFRLQQQGLIKKQDGAVGITETGKQLLLRLSPNRDGVWKLVIFDIPEKQRAARDSLREKMKEIGCVRFNDSVWVFPFPCQKEIDFIANYWRVGQYVHFILARDITNRDLLEKHFNL